MRAGPARPEELLAHADFVRGLARSLLWGEDGAEDVEQETWAAAVESPPRDPGAARSWLAAVVRNFVRQRRRAEARRRVREEAAARPEGAPSTEEVLAREEQRRRVVEAVLALDAPRREVVLLRYFEALPPREIARRLGEPVETVRTRIKRALAELRERLDDGHGGDRRAWALLLVPLARGAEGGEAGWAAGGLAMGAAAKAGAGVAAAAIVAAAWWAWEEEDPAPGASPVTISPSMEVASTGPAETPPAPPSPVPAGPTFRGRVLDAVSEEPLAGARVRAFDPVTDAALGEAAAAEDGSFALPAGDAKRATLRLAAEGFEAVERRSAAADVALTLRAPRLCTVTVRVRDGRLDPVAGAEVTLWARGREEIRGATDAEGNAVFDRRIPSGMLHLKVEPPGTRRDLAWATAKEVLSPGESRELSLTLPSGLSCRGRVVDAETGVDIPGARVLAVSGMRLRAETPDAEGWFHFDGFPADREGWGSGVLANADGYETAKLNFVPKTQREITVPLRKALSHRFRVLGVDGAPLAGATVIVYGDGRLPPVSMDEGTTDATGECLRTGFSPEESAHYLVQARSPDGSARAFAEFYQVGIEGLSAREKRDGAIVLTLAPRDRSLAVRTRRGAVAEEGVRVRVGWVPAGREYAFRGKLGGPPRTPDLHITLPAELVVQGDTDPEGKLRLEGLPRGTLVVEIEGRSDRGWLDSTRDGDATLDIDLDEGMPERFEVRGLVRTKEGPVAGASLSLLDSEGRLAGGAVTSKDGRFRIETFRGPPSVLRLSLLEAGGSSYRTLEFPAPPAGEEADLLVE